MGRAKTIVLTGGGTAGHVMPHIAMLPYYQQKKWRVIYIGSQGMEKEIVKRAGLDYYTIQTGKLRRYFSWQNLTDIIRLLIGVAQSLLLLLRKKPDLVFSKGGFVSVPVAFAAWLLRIPLVSHESDLTPGLANRLIKPFCRVIFYSFPESLPYLKGTIAIEAGIPVRESLFQGNREEGVKLCQFTQGERPTILVMGGSSGAERINQSLVPILPQLLLKYNVIHLTGKGKALAFAAENYKAFEYVEGGLEHLYATADLVICRAGANSLFEMKALGKAMLLIPLEMGSRGDQVDNAKSFEQQGWAKVLRETELSAPRFAQAIEEAWQAAPELKKQLERSKGSGSAAQQIIARLEKICG